ncbi:Signal transduction histidine kinase [Amycolatopsis marina]|uniref:histidine kinase n=1 Tax=Amycolatopsis marina TaxID=490629 RepID=A0A1I1C660_9PSEU|nr:HAMP domain-containing sensor histidine kinase [Amycolatopsis marina]SFB57897.1 Signal transduction histidine kinase [Amycolatopsis marina]
MRRRLLLVLVAFALAAVAGFATPLLASTAGQRTQELLIGRTADLDRFAELAQVAVESGDVAALAADAQRYSDLYREGVVVTDRQGLPLVQAGLSTADPRVRALVAGAVRNQPGPRPPTILPWSAEPILFARPVGTGTRVSGAVVLRASVEAAARDVGLRWATVVAGALLAGLAFVLLAMLLARWVLRPLHALERGVHTVAEGRRAQVPAGAGPQELRALATSFNRMSDAVVAAAEQQRRLIADTSHQLRNPLAALRLRVDSLAGHVDEPGTKAYHATVTEVDRLESLLDGLLALAVAESATTRLAAGIGAEEAPADVPTVVAERVDAWSAAADRSGVRLDPEAATDPLLVDFPESELSQVLDVVLDNAIAYAGRGARVRISCSDRPDAGTATLTVADDGPGLTETQLTRATERFWRGPGTQRPRGTGLGLAIAQRQLAARGARLELGATRPHGLTVSIELPLAPSGTRR